MNIPKAGESQVQSFQNEQNLNNYFQNVSSDAVNNINSNSAVQKDISQFISTISNKEVVGLNNAQFLSSIPLTGNQFNQNEEISKYFQQNAATNSYTGNYDINNLGIGTVSTVPAPTGNDDISKYFQNIPGANISSTTTNLDLNNAVGTISSIPAPTGNEDINKYFQNINNTNPATPNFDLSNLEIGTSSTVPAPTGVDDINKYLQQTNTSNNNFDLNNLNLGQTTATGAFDLDNLNIGQNTTLNTGNIDISQFGVNATTISSTGSADISNYGLGIASSVEQQTGNNDDLNKYFQGANFSSVNGNFDLNNLNNIAGQQTTNTFSSIGNADLNNFNFADQALRSNITFAGSQIPNNDNAYGITQTQVTSSKVEGSYASPLQSYSYNYSYTVPVTSQVNQ